MADNPNYLPTPEGYATPEQLKSTREYAKALLQGNLQQPVHHWTQGVSNMVSALIGGNLDYNAAQQEKGARDYDAANVKANIPQSNYPANGAPPIPFSSSPGSTGAKNVDAGGGPEQKAIASIETGGEKDPYHALGPVIQNPHSAYYGDRAHGKYQVMGKNIGPWSKEVLGHEETPEQFDNDPNAQEAIFKAKFTNPRDWFGHGRSDGYITGDEYVRRFNARMPHGAPSAATQPSAFTGPSDFSQVPAVQAMNAAMSPGAPSQAGTQVAGDPQVAAAKPAMPATQPFNPAPGNQPLINPGLIQKPPAYTPDQLQHILASPWLPQEVKDRAYGMALQQNQAMFMPSPTGSGQVLINPNIPGQQQYFAPPPHFGKAKLGDMEVETPGNFGPTGTYTTQTPGGGAPAAVGPRSEAEPQTAPTAAPAEAPAPGGAVTENAPAPATGQPNTQVASLEPTAGTQGAPKTAAAVPPQQDHPYPGLTKFAQSGALPPGLEGAASIVGPDMAKAYAGKKTFDNKLEADKEAASEATKFGSKKYDTLSTQAQAARTMAPNIDLALAMLNDPNIHQGLVSGVQDVWSRFKAAALGDKYANAPNEVFDKLMAGTVLGTMKTALGGLGQVRLAEIALLNKANASRFNTDASNRAVLEISKRGIEKVDQLDQLGQQYASGDEVVDPISGKVLLPANIGADGQIAPRHGLDSGYDKIARKFTLDNPTFTPEQIKHYETIFDTGRDPNEPQAPAPGKSGQESAPQVGSRKQFKQGWGVWNGTQYVPEGQ